MNVVFIGNFSYPYGMANTKRIQFFIDHIKNNNVSVKLLLLRQGDRTIPKNKLTGFHNGVYYKTIGNKLSFNYKLIFYLFSYFINGFIFIIKSHKTNKNILFVYSGVNLENILFVILAKFIGYKIIVDIVEDFEFINEDLHFFAKLKNKSVVFFQNNICLFSNGIIVISNYLKNKFNIITKNKIPVILIPISAKTNNCIKNENFDDITKIIYAGSFANKDGVWILLDAFTSYIKTNNKCKLYLLGTGKNLLQYKKKYSGNNYIEFTGYVDDNKYYEILHSADILCMTRVKSIYANAGFPFKLGEYLATGKPVIASNVSDVSYYLENYKDAIIVEPENENQIINAFEYLINNKKQALEIGLNGQKKCNEFFNPKKNSELLLNLINII